MDSKFKTAKNARITCMKYSYSFFYNICHAKQFSTWIVFAFLFSFFLIIFPEIWFCIKIHREILSLDIQPRLCEQYRRQVIKRSGIYAPAKLKRRIAIGGIQHTALTAAYYWAYLKLDPLSLIINQTEYLVTLERTIKRISGKKFGSEIVD